MQFLLRVASQAMLKFPTVRTRCGCCDLKIPCIILAALHLAITLLAASIFTYKFILEFNTVSLEEIIGTAVGVEIMATFILCTYWFIQGVVTVSIFVIEIKVSILECVWDPQKNKRIACAVHCFRGSWVHNPRFLPPKKIFFFVLRNIPLK